MDTLYWIESDGWELIVLDCDYILKDLKYKWLSNYISYSPNYHI